VKRSLMEFLCDPVDQSELEIRDEILYPDGTIKSGVLASKGGREYLITEGIPRFVSSLQIKGAVKSFGDEWNYFNYDLFKANWLNHVVKNTFGGTSVFKGKIVVDCGAGSGMQSRWMAESGAERVIALELSHSVDGIMKTNLAGMNNVDVIQCSIDTPPIKTGSIPGIVICHNVIQHTPSVERTARALWGIVGKGGELVFNCYMKYPENLVWMARWVLVYRPLRAILSRCPFMVILLYAKIMAILRFIPVLEPLLEKSQFVVRGNVPPRPDLTLRQYRQAVLNTYDWYGSHAYQAQKTGKELRNLVAKLQPDSRYIQNLEEHLKINFPPGLAIRITKS